MEAKNILITGTNGGVAGRVADYLFSKGHRHIALHYRNEKDQIRETLKKYDLSPEKHLFQADLCNENDVQKMKTQINERLGSVSSVVNLAGASTNNMSWKMSVDEFQKVVNDNLLTAFIVSKTFIPEMRASSWGRIINTSSVVAFSGVAGASHYCAAKAGLVGLTKSLAHELINKNITVNVLALGYFDFGLIDTVPEPLKTQIRSNIPAGRFGNQKDVGSLVEYILSEDTSFMTGQTFHINGGQY